MDIEELSYEGRRPNSMTVGIARFTLRLPGNTSLKGKRKVVRSVIEKVRYKFKLSVAEVGEQDVLQRAVLGMAVVGNDGRMINAILDKAINYVESLNIAELIDDEINLIAF